MNKNLLVVKDLKGYYRGTFGVVHAVDGVSLKVGEGERVGIAGESGCGKSSFAQLITGTPTPLLHYEGGDVIADGFNIWKIPPETLRKEVKCERLSYVPQAMLNSLNPVIRVKEFIADMLKERTGRKHSVDEASKIAAEHFEKLGLDARVLGVYPHELSGGMMQRAIIAISTMASPKLLITDEPTSALDVTSQRRMIELLIDIQRKGIIKSLICISHDLAALNQLCDRIVIMYAGIFVEEGKADDVINRPLHPYTRALMDSLLPLEPETKDKRLSSIGGIVPDLRNPPPGCRFNPRCEKCTKRCTYTEPPTIEVKGRSVKCWLYSRDESE
jgi:peptide/nickel transport system ATP-binding protein